MELKRTAFPDLGQNETNESKTKKPRRGGFKKGEYKLIHRSDGWKENTEECFYNWLTDIKPRILTRSGKWEIFEPTDKQREVIHGVFEQANGKLKHSLALSIQPRRHGKSTVFALILLFFFTARRNQNLALLGNNDEHSNRVQLRLLKNIIKNTYELRLRIDPDECFYNDHIRKDSWNNYIFKASTTTAGAFGDRINILWVSDLHATPDIEPFNALQASLLDSEDSLILIDSNADVNGGPVHEIQKAAESDSSIWVNHIEYRDFDEFTEKAPAWIDRSKARRIQKTALQADFDRDILGKRSSLVNRLFPEEVILKCQDSYKIPVIDVQSLVHGRPYSVGGGLDRAKNLLAGITGDHTVWTTILKVANLSGEPEFYILNQVKFPLNTSKAIKAVVKEDHDRYGFTNVCLENYEVTDLRPWFADQGIECELITATDTVQNASFPEMNRVAREGRLHIPANCQDLVSELSTFVYSQRKMSNGSYSFGHVSSKFHDDFVYSTAWAIYSLRNEILSAFNLNHIDCTLPNAARRSACFMMGGNLVLHCSEQCSAFHDVKTMFQEFKAFHALDSELTIVEFYKAYVKADGLIQYNSL